MDKKLPVVSPLLSEEQALQDTNTATTRCLNCGTEHNGKYCPNCGQRFDVKRFSWKELFLSVSRGFFNADRGFLFTIKMLCRRPGKVINEYIEGKRVRYFPPFSLLFVVVAIYAVLVGVIKLDPRAKEEAQNALEEMQTQAGANGVDLSNLVSEEAPVVLDMGTVIDLADAPVLNYVVDKLENNYAIVVLLALPFLVIALRACFRKPFRARYNWAETFLIGAFLMAQFFVVMGVIQGVTFLFPSFSDIGETIASIGLICLLAWNVYDLTNFQKKRTYFWRSLGSVFLFFAMVILAMVLLTFIFAILFSVIKFK